MTALSSTFEQTTRNFWPLRFPFFVPKPANPFNLLNEAKLLGAEAYRDRHDKGTKRSLWTHIREVENETEYFSGGQMSERRYAMAVLHELFEIMDNGEGGKPLYTPIKVIARGFDRAFVSGVYALRREPGEPYLAYIHHIALSGDIDAIAVKIGDLRVNKRTRPFDGELPQKLQEKKEFLYPASEAYLLSVLAGQVNPRLVSPVEFLRGHSQFASTMSDARAVRHYGVVRGAAPLRCAL